MSNPDASRAEDRENMVTLTNEELTSICRQVLSQHGFSPRHVEALAETFVAAEMDGSRSHGIYRLLVYATNHRSTSLTPLEE